MEHAFLLKAAVVALIPVGLAIGICFFVFAWLYMQSIRGIDVASGIRAIKLIILILFTAFVGIFALVRYAVIG